MSIYFDFETINKLTGENYNDYRQQKEFSLDELSQYNGENGNPAYVAIEGIVYDITNEPVWNKGKHMGITAGEDLSEQFDSCYGMSEILSNAPQVGMLTEESDMNAGYNRCMNRQVTQNTSKFKPDDWIRYIDPLVNYALRETNQQGANARRAYQKYFVLGVLVGLGKTPQEAINQVQEWQTTGESQILKSTGTGTTTGGAGTGGGFGGTGTGTGTTTGGMGTGGGFGGTGTGTGTTTGGMGTGVGFGGTGIGTGMTGGASGGAGGGFGAASGGTGTAGRYETESEAIDDRDRRDRLYFD